MEAPDPKGWQDAIEFAESRMPFGRFIITALVTLAVIAAFVWLFRWLLENAVKPIAGQIAQIGSQVDQFTVLVALVLLSFVIVAIAFVVVARNQRRWQRSFVSGVADAFDQLVAPIVERLDRLETEALSVGSARKLESRLSKIEPVEIDHTTAKDDESVKREILLRLLERSSDVKAVGRILPKQPPDATASS